MSMTYEQMRQQIEQEQRRIDSMMQVNKALEQQKIDFTEWLAEQMAAGFVNVTQQDTGRKKGRGFSTSDDGKSDDNTSPTPCTKRHRGDESQQVSVERMLTFQGWEWLARD